MIEIEFSLRCTRLKGEHQVSYRTEFPAISRYVATLYMFYLVSPKVRYQSLKEEPAELLPPADIITLRNR